MTSEVIDLINKFADKEPTDVSDGVDDWAGGNVDDAYSMGLSDGEIFFAKMLKERLDNG